MKHLKAVIFDWAGTTVDYGCLAPTMVFVDMFRELGIELSTEEVRQFMGLPKLDHTRKLFKLDSVRKQFEAKHHRLPDETDVRALYARIEPAMEEAAPRFAHVIPGVPELVSRLRSEGVAIGSCTGYTRKMMDDIVPVAAAEGFSPDAVVVPGDVGDGRPSPKMIFENLKRLNVASPAWQCVKVGDTLADIAEGRNAGCWTVAWNRCGNELGLSEAEAAALDPAELKKRLHEINSRLLKAGADYVVSEPARAFAVFEEIDRRIGAGIRPGSRSGVVWSGAADLANIPDNPYLLLTPGPLSTSKGVRAAALRDWCTWDADYNNLVQEIRHELLEVAGVTEATHAVTLMQGSGTFGVESVIGSALGPDSRLLVISNGHYGKRIARIAQVLRIPCDHVELGEVARPGAACLEHELERHADATHVAFVHSETTTGILNPLEELAPVVKKHGKTLIVDAMSSFGGIPIEVGPLGIDFLISSANKCIQGIPGFSFIIARREAMEQCKGNARSLSLDLYAQYAEMEKGHGKWRYTSPTHVVRAFHQALAELKAEGGVPARHARYVENQRTLVRVMAENGFRPLLPEAWQSPIITSFRYPNDEFDFRKFYEFIKAHGFVLYPGKISQEPTFRIGNIGEVHPADMIELGRAVAAYLGR